MYSKANEMPESGPSLASTHSKILLLIGNATVVFLFVKQLDALFFRKLANHKLAVFLRHDIAVETLDHHLLVLRAMDNAIVGFVQIHVSHNGVAVNIAFYLVFQRSPRANVAPVKGSLAHENLFCFLFQFLW